MFFDMFSKKLKKEDFLCDMFWECEEEGQKDSRYRFSIEPKENISLELYEEQTGQILQRIPHIIKDYKQKFRRKT